MRWSALTPRCSSATGERLSLSSVMGIKSFSVAVFALVLAIYLAMLVAVYDQVAMTVTFFLWWLIGFSFAAPAQARILKGAADAPNLASTLISTAFNIGIAAGPWLGGIALNAGWGYARLPWISVFFVARSITFLTFETCHRPPRAVRTPRILSACAIPRRLVMPEARTALTMGRTFGHRRTVTVSPARAGSGRPPASLSRMGQACSATRRRRSAPAIRTRNGPIVAGPRARRSAPQHHCGRRSLTSPWAG
jgi:hypothetical protein